MSLSRCPKSDNHRRRPEAAAEHFRQENVMIWFDDSSSLFVLQLLYHERWDGDFLPHLAAGAPFTNGCVGTAAPCPPQHCSRGRSEKALLSSFTHSFVLHRKFIHTGLNGLQKSFEKYSYLFLKNLRLRLTDVRLRVTKRGKSMQADMIHSPCTYTVMKESLHFAKWFIK